MQYWVVLLAVGMSGCTLLTPWRHGALGKDLVRVMASCETTARPGGAASWIELVRCQNERAHSLLTEHSSPYAGLIEAALACRLMVAQQVDAGMIAAEEGEAKLATLDAHLQTLPASVLELLDTIAAVASPSGRTKHY